MIGIAFNEQVWWFVARSSGIAAWVLVTLSVCWGLMLSTKAAAKATQPSQILDLHRFFGGLSVAFTAIHILGLVMDSYVYFSWFEVLVPFKSQWQPREVAWGVFAFYLLLALEITSLMMKKLPKPLWRHIHRTSLALYVLATYHGITAGSDTGNVWYQMMMLASINIVAFLAILLALARRKSNATAKRAARPRPVHRTAA
ncbi:MAG: hypothetical protein GY724_18615 [Actinomycetia bacterium]|nr:hypothetical protein [Actinomycetes bacterium]MCP4225145.1 hypothetical protein [Actinomycetes bacterium]MCP5031891.1 hypothetical protein [Actinomycetes bacterium]